MFGTTTLSDSSPYRQDVSILRADTHPDWNPAGYFSMMIIQLATPVNITDYVRPICLSEIDNEWEAFENCWIAGWGITEASIPGWK